MFEGMYRRFVFNLKGGLVMKSLRKEMFIELCIGVAAIAGLMTAGHFLKPWAIAQLSALAYVGGLVFIWAKTK